VNKDWGEKGGSPSLIEAEKKKKKHMRGFGGNLGKKYLEEDLR